MDHYDDDTLEVDGDHSTRMDDAESLIAAPVDQLERFGRWLTSIPRDHVIALRETPEYEDFLRAFERLGHAHRRVISMNRNAMPNEDNIRLTQVHDLAPLDPLSSFPNNFLQHLSADDVILRVFEFLECQSLIRMALTCSRFRQLAYRSATQRTYDVANTRQLNNVMQLLRAKEQIDGVGNGMQDSHVQVPILLLSRRILVTNSGDPEFNGVYFCTGNNGNGFVFTKPRFPDQQAPRTSSSNAYRPNEEDVDMATTQHHQHPQNAPNGLNPNGPAVARIPIDGTPSLHFESEATQPGQKLRCIIAKRFSDETLLWYLSKEVEASEVQDGVQSGEVIQVFAFWAKLMLIGDASPDICRYPSQSSILARHNEGWQSLSTTRAMHAPTVELLD